MTSTIYVGDRVWAEYLDIGMSHREIHAGYATVTAVHPTPRVRPDGASHDLPVPWIGIKHKAEQ
jgi:hypothetical protein